MMSLYYHFTILW